MEALTKRKIKSGKEFDALFPVANLRDETVKKGASVSDTVKFIPKVVKETLPQTEKIAQELKSSSLHQTCKNIWDFVYHHIAYNKDDDGLEQIRAPARTWHDRSRGVDCDCYTVFISSILTNLKIPHTLRIAKYRKDYFQHIYPVVHSPSGKLITIDCVVDYFNYEEPYTEIKDTTMDLQYLSGTENSEDGSLGKKRKLKDILKSGLHIVNRANPATLLLRNGVLASMKLNIMKVAQRLKYAYLSDADAKAKGMDMGKFHQLKQIKDKLENIFYGAGGKPENLKKAILTGKGNKSHDVKGLGNYGEEFSGTYNESTPLAELLGKEIYGSENPEALSFGAGLGETLGEPVTAAAITASSGAIATISLLIKNIGNLFPKKDSADSKDFDSANTQPDTQDVSKEIAENKDEISKMDASARKADTSDTDDSSGDSKDDPSKKTFWDKNKTWIKPTAIGATGIGLLYLGYHALTSEKKEKNRPQLSGAKKKTLRPDKKEPVALL